MTAQHARQRHPAARPQTETAEGLVGIVRAARQMPAVQSGQRCKGIAVGSDQPASRLAWNLLRF